MLRNFYQITERQIPISGDVRERVRSLLFDYHMSEEVIRECLSSQANLFELDRALAYHTTGMEKRYINGSGTRRDLNKSIYARFIPEIQEYLKNTNGDYRGAFNEFNSKYGINKPFIYQVANEMGFSTSNRKYTKNIYKDLVPDIIVLLEKGEAIVNIQKKFAYTGISEGAIQKIKKKYLPELVGVRSHYSKNISEKLKQKLREGYSVEELSTQYGYSKELLERWKREC